MLQLSEVLEMQSAKLRRDALQLINATVSGTATTMFWDVMDGIEEDVNMKEMEEAQSLGEVMRLHKANKEDVPAITKSQADAAEAEAFEAMEEDIDNESTTSSNVGVEAKKKTLTQLRVFNSTSPYLSGNASFSPSDLQSAGPFPLYLVVDGRSLVADDRL